MTKVTIDRDLLERLLYSNSPARFDATEYNAARAELFAILAHPAQQSEAVEVVGYMDTSDRLWADTTRPELMFPLMTVAQHHRILAASVPAGCKMVPVGLLERLAGNSCDPDCCIAYWRAELRALLASAEGAKDE